MSRSEVRGLVSRRQSIDALREADVLELCSIIMRLTQRNSSKRTFGILRIHKLISNRKEGINGAYTPRMGERNN